MSKSKVSKMPPLDGILAPERPPLAVSVHYAFTLTLNPRLYKDLADRQLDAVRRDVMDRLHPKLFPIRAHKLFSKLTIGAFYTKKYNVHFHGIIQLCGDALPNDCLKLLHDTVRSSTLLGKERDFKQIDDWNGWIDYIKDAKQNPIIEVLWDDYEVFDNPMILFQ